MNPISEHRVGELPVFSINILHIFQDGRGLGTSRFSNFCELSIQDSLDIRDFNSILNS